MTVRIARGTVTQIRRTPEFFVLQVRTADLDRASEALARAAADIAALDGGKQHGGQRTPSFVSPVIPSPAGPLIQVDADALPRRMLADIPALVVRRLEEAGLTEAVVDSPQPGGQLDQLAEWPQGAVLHLHPYPSPDATPVPVPPAWLDQATAWLARCLPANASLVAEVGRIQFPVAIEDAGTLLAAAARARTSCLLVHGDPGGQVHAVHLHLALEPGLLLGIGGPATDLAESARALQEVGRQLAPHGAYACLGIEPTLRALRRGEPAVEGVRRGSESLLRKLGDEVAYDGYQWQVLTAGHLARLGEPPDDARPLPGGAVEVAIGEITDWLPGSNTIDIARSLARMVLAPLLVDTATCHRLAQARIARRRDAG